MFQIFSLHYWLPEILNVRGCDIVKVTQEAVWPPSVCTTWIRYSPFRTLSFWDDLSLRIRLLTLSFEWHPKNRSGRVTFFIAKVSGNLLAFPLSAPPIVSFKTNLLAQQEPAQSIVRNKYHLQYLEEWFRYDKQGNWYLITLPVGKTWPFLIAAPQFFITTALPYRCAFWACTTRVWRNMRTFFCTNVG